MGNARIREKFAGNVGVAFAEPPDPSGVAERHRCLRPYPPFQGVRGPRRHRAPSRQGPHHRLFTNPSLALGEAYTNGTLTVKDADLYDFLDLIGRNN